MFIFLQIPPYSDFLAIRVNLLLLAPPPKHTPELTSTLSLRLQSRRQVGAAGVDYPTYSEVPPGLAFTCTDRIPGYYADPEAQCQVS